jgi:phage terminase small subunit
MPILRNPRHEAFAQALARGMSAAAAYAEVGYRPHRHNAATLARKEHISVRVAELQEEQLAIHQQATADAAANAKVTIACSSASTPRSRLLWSSLPCRHPPRFSSSLK